MFPFPMKKYVALKNKSWKNLLKIPEILQKLVYREISAHVPLLIRHYIDIVFFYLVVHTFVHKIEEQFTWRI